MEINTLKTFCEIVETCPIYYTDDSFPLRALLRALFPLEEYFGAKLFGLDEKKFDVTEAGRTFYPFAKEMIKSMEGARKAISVAGKGESVLLVGTCTGSGNSFMVSVLGEYRKIHPKTRVVLRVDTSAEIIEKVQDGIFELGITGYRFNYDQLSYLEILQDELVAICSPDHRFASKKNIHLKDILEEPFILEQKGSGSREALFEELARNEIEISDLNIAMEVGLHESVKSAVISGLGISILPWLSVDRDVKSGKIVALRFKEGKLARKFYLMTRKDIPLSPTAQTFYQFLKECIGGHHG